MICSAPPFKKGREKSKPPSRAKTRLRRHQVLSLIKLVECFEHTTLSRLQEYPVQILMNLKYLAPPNHWNSSSMPDGRLFNIDKNFSAIHTTDHTLQGILNNIRRDTKLCQENSIVNTPDIRYKLHLISFHLLYTNFNLCKLHRSKTEAL